MAKGFRMGGIFGDINTFDGIIYENGVFSDAVRPLYEYLNGQSDWTKIIEETSSLQISTQGASLGSMGFAILCTAEINTANFSLLKCSAYPDSDTSTFQANDYRLAVWNKSNPTSLSDGLVAQSNLINIRGQSSATIGSLALSGAQGKYYVGIYQEMDTYTGHVRNRIHVSKLWLE